MNKKFNSGDRVVINSREKCGQKVWFDGIDEFAGMSGILACQHPAGTWVITGLPYTWPEYCLGLVASQPAAPHPHAETIKAWADGAEIEYFDEATRKWVLLTKLIGWYPEIKYRVYRKVELPTEVARKIYDLAKIYNFSFIIDDKLHISVRKPGIVIVKNSVIVECYETLEEFKEAYSL